jgi:hypothetical protein
MVRLKKFQSKKRITDFASFWKFYLKEHSKPLTRWLHLLGTSAAVLTVIISLILGNYWGLLAALVLGYSPAWFAHFFVEKNKPATFRNPLWSLIADFKMAFLLWVDLGRLAVGKKAKLK